MMNKPVSTWTKVLSQIIINQIIINTLGLGRRVDIVDVIDYVNTSTCVKCVDASQINNMAAPSESMEAPGEEPAAKKPRPRSSKVWEYFRQKPNSMVLCKLCKTEMAYHSSTSAMHEHLKRKRLALCEDSRKISPQVTVVFLFTFPAVYEWKNG